MGLVKPAPNNIEALLSKAKGDGIVILPMILVNKRLKPGHSLLIN